MKSNLTTGAIWIGVFTAFLGTSPRWNAEAHADCGLCVEEFPVTQVESLDCAIEATEFMGSTEVIPTGRMMLVLNCPADSRVWIDGHATDSVGVSRQFDLQFLGDCYELRVTIRLPKSGHPGLQRTLTIRNQQNIVWTITRKQLETHIIDACDKRSNEQARLKH